MKSPVDVTYLADTDLLLRYLKRPDKCGVQSLWLKSELVGTKTPFVSSD